MLRGCFLKLSPLRHSTSYRLFSRNSLKLKYIRDNPLSNNSLFQQTRITNSCFIYTNNRLFCSQKKQDDEDDLPETPLNEDTYQHHLPATVAIPEVWPHVPVIAMKRNPVFPRFMKILEVFLLLFKIFI